MPFSSVTVAGLLTLITVAGVFHTKTLLKETQWDSENANFVCNLKIICKRHSQVSVFSTILHEWNRNVYNLALITNILLLTSVLKGRCYMYTYNIKHFSRIMTNTNIEALNPLHVHVLIKCTFTHKKGRNLYIHVHITN